METSTIILILTGLVYSSILISVGISVAEDLFLSSLAKKWLIFIMIAVPIFGVILAKFKTRQLGLSPNCNSHGDTLSTSGSNYSDSGDCGGGGE
ncbi:hypothetical protein [Glaciecola sp. 1036]|uniref:hypothetical protein n=1 Tax=Alteromonadaceae TaxID=72275 RepID=UPI003D010242